MQYAKVPILGFAAFSGTGKTTLLAQMIPLLRHNGVRVGLIKHGHHDFDVDVPGKDSYRLRLAGASPVMIVSKRRRAVMTEIDPEREPTLDEQLRHLDQSELDLVMVEGFKREAFPKIELYRSELGHEFLYLNDPNIIAVAADCPLSLPDTVTALDINRPSQIVEFILLRFITHYA